MMSITNRGINWSEAFTNWEKYFEQFKKLYIGNKLERK